MLINFAEMLSILDGFYSMPGLLDREKIRDASIAIRAFSGGLFSHQEVCDLLSEALGLVFEPHPFGAICSPSAADDIGLSVALALGSCEEVFHA